VQGLRLCDDDQLRRVLGRHPVPQRLHPRQQSAPSQLQDKQTQNVNVNKDDDDTTRQKQNTKRRRRGFILVSLINYE